MISWVRKMFRVHNESEIAIVTLTSFGRSIAKRLGARKWAISVAEKFKDETAGYAPLQINEFSKKQVTENLDNDMSIHSEEVMHELGIPARHALDVLHVMLRDELLRLHGMNR